MAIFLRSEQALVSLPVILLVADPHLLNQHSPQVVAWGSCASNGCVQAAKPNPTGAKPVYKLISDKPIINVPGCPPIADVMMAVVTHLLVLGQIPALDSLGRPKEF